ncbi:MAG: 3-hydroxyisobutyrate dehydrogenase [Gammaproteobacteria bacterium]|nr:3-hydroxyisobutyrate dehydrogenase [Gammaproteobacteria bacterium]
MTRIGFVGLGNMGGPMARNLVNAGHEVKVFDLVSDLMVAVGGATPQATGADAAKGVDVFISMLPAGRHVDALYSGEDGIVNQCDPGTLLIDCSTIDPATAQKVAALASSHDQAMLDAPVSGGTAGAEAGTLTFMVGGTPEALEAAQAVLDVMGGKVLHAGASGAGQIAKVCNNMLLAIQMAGTAEALALGVNNGLDAGVLSEIMKQSSGSNWPLSVYNPYPGVMDNVPASRGYTGGFLVDLMTKDLGLAMETAQNSRSSIPLGALANNLFRVHEQLNGAGGLDFSSIQWLYQPDLKR